MDGAHLFRPQRRRIRTQLRRLLRHPHDGGRARNMGGACCCGSPRRRQACSTSFLRVVWFSDGEIETASCSPVFFSPPTYKPKLEDKAKSVIVGGTTGAGGGVGEAEMQHNIASKSNYFISRIRRLGVVENGSEQYKGSTYMRCLIGGMAKELDVGHWIPVMVANMTFIAMNVM